MEYEDEEFNKLFITESPLLTTMLPAVVEMDTTSPVLLNATSLLFNATTVTPATSTTGVLPSLASLKFWNENRKICELFSQALYDLTRDLDPFAALLIIVALVIAIGGAIAIFCQCQMWRKSKRQRHFDTSSWLEYSLDREKLTHSNSNLHNGKLHRQMENKKYISKLFASSLLPPMPMPHPREHGGHAAAGQKHHILSGGPLGRTQLSRLGDSQLYLNSSSPGRQFIVDIDQCQLVQSFMKHSETGKQYLEKQKKLKKEQQQGKAIAKAAAKKGKGATKKVVADSKKIRQNRAKQSKKLAGKGAPDTLPFFANASISSSSKLSTDPESRPLANSGACMNGLQKEYETQTVELNLTGSDDGDSQANLSIDEKIYERIRTYPRAPGVTVLASSGGGGGSKANSANSKPSPSTSQSTVKMQSNGGLNQHQATSKVHLPQMRPSTGRLRQIVPAGNISEAVARANHSHGLNGKNSREPFFYPNSIPSVAGTLAKNPLYSEIGDQEESLMFGDERHPATRSNVSGASKPTVGGFALENDGHRLYAAIQPPMNRQLTYSTFIKPPSPPF